MPESELEQMLEAMPKIAEAVKLLPPDLHAQAFDELIRAFKGGETPVASRTARASGPIGMQPAPNSEADVDALAGLPESSSGDAESGAIPSGSTGSRPKRGSKAGAARKVTRKSWAPDRNIDFWPEGRKSFQDLAEEKKPASLHEKNLLAVYWLEQVAELPAISVAQVLAAYKAMDWDEPSQPDVYLRKTASGEHWIDTSSTSNIKTTPGGRNMVKNMPVKKSSK